MGSKFSRHTIDEDEAEIARIALGLKNFNMSGHREENFVLSESINWQADKDIKSQDIRLSNMPYKVTIACGPTIGNLTNVSVEVSPVVTSIEDEPVPFIRRDFPLALYFNFGSTDVLGHYLDLIYGRVAAVDTPALMGHFAVENLYERTIQMDAFSPRIESSDGSALRKMGPISQLEKSSFMRTLRGPTFYTSKNGYRVKLDLEFGKEIEAKITFLSGRYDYKLSHNFCHLTSVALLGRPFGKTNEKFVVKSGIQNLIYTRSYKYSMGTLKQLEDDGLIIDDCLYIYVSIKELDPRIMTRIADLGHPIDEKKTKETTDEESTVEESIASGSTAGKSTTKKTIAVKPASEIISAPKPAIKIVSAPKPTTEEPTTEETTA